eukprot:CAMPEP_0114429054 /NCGR_PEP_ID=MMETSP0103-20121206/9268_1 /TAXON_ID=37642 ORGANISM="Paraphysomonas imperforata, Strain PA2" /NCGR_SAMPLE_ID=MMETSP0103 /ASSEMBLY_ACC=CAM_ASM_000201 /LENGTH=444 /DNA_ID=CAMNT_0001598339 /DNA_START=172 /DNA_END=1506 /DNA_ORIENTATION=+
MSSKDEPKGIPDDFFLVKALDARHIRYKYQVWTETTVESFLNIHQPPLVLIRSLWDGRTPQGSKPQLLQLFASITLKWPRMKYEYELIDWTAHKCYILALEKAGVEVVPTCIIASSDQNNCRVCAHLSDSHSNVIVDCTPGGVKRAMEARGWGDAILKPASSGGRCEGVIRLSLEEWSAGMAFAVAALLRQGDCVLQPFLPAVSAKVIGSGMREDGASSLLGEVCVVCIDGEISHAIHKNPRMWGWHEASCSCAGSPLDLDNSICSCLATMSQSTHRGAVSNIFLSEKDLDSSSEHLLSSSASRLLCSAPVEVVELPLPEKLLDSVNQVLGVIRSRSEGVVPLMCRLDFLPRLDRTGHGRGHGCNDDEDNGSDRGLKRNRDEIHERQQSEESGAGVEEEQKEEVEWLFSEMEGHWCEGFFRAASDRVMDMFADAVRKRAKEYSS